MRIARQNIAFMTVHGDLMTVTISLRIQPFATILILYQRILKRLHISLGKQPFAHISAKWALPSMIINRKIIMFR
jgi:hypothetical protein